MMTEAGLYREVLPSDSLTNKKFYEEVVDEETASVGMKRSERISSPIRRGLRKKSRKES